MVLESEFHNTRVACSENFLPLGANAHMHNMCSGLFGSDLGFTFFVRKEVCFNMLLGGFVGLWHGFFVSR